MARVDRAIDILNGAAAVSPEVVSAGDAAAAAVRAVVDAEGPGAADRIEIVAPEELELVCDGDLVGEALAEILKNALRASPPQARVRLGIVNAPPDRVRFEIGDAGQGISEYLLECGIENLAPERPGAVERWQPGLGLVVAKTIVERHGGHFGIMSEPGRGTEVFLSFRSAAERVEADPALRL
jgi:signal transduction histidine kinase